MGTIAGFTETGRQLTGPASDLVELTAANGLRHTAIVFHSEFHGHRALNEALEVVIGFLESPLVTGLTDLVEWERERCAFIYPTGQGWSVAEVIRSLADTGESEGHIRAGLELMYAAGQILNEAAERGERDGVYSHGGLTPRRIMLKKDGQVEIIGYALPQVEILQFPEDEQRVPGVDSFRYCPPERIEFAPESLSSDLFGLSLVAFELMTGRPVYDGLVNDIRQQAARGECSRRLFRFRDKLPDSVREVLARALKPSMEDRFDSGEDFIEAVRAVLSSSDATGDSLMDMMAKVSAQGRRIGKALESGKTQMLSREQLQEMLDEPEPIVERKTWTPTPSRAGRRSAVPVEPPPAERPLAVSTETAPPAEEIPQRKWSTPSRQRRRVVRARVTDEVLGGEPAPPAEQAPSLEKAARTSGDNAADLLARIRASSSMSPAHASAREESRRSAASVVESILSSSGGRTSSAAPRIVAGRVRRVTRRRSITEGGDKTSLISLSIAQGLANTSSARAEEEARAADAARAAAEDAARIAAEDAARAAAEEAARAAAEDAARAAAEEAARAAAEEAVRAAAEARAQEAAESRARAAAKARARASAEARKRAEAKARAAEAAAQAKQSTTARADVSPTAPFSSDLSRAPDPIATASSRKGSATFTTLRGSGGRPLRMRLPTQATAAEAIGWLLGNVIPIRTDLTGRISGWYRLTLKDALVPPSRLLCELDVEAVYALRFVPNRIQHADIEIVGAAAPVRLIAPVGDAVPAGTLVDHLAAWLSLPAGAWGLEVDGQLLSPFAILADLPAAAGMRRLKVVRR